MSVAERTREAAREYPFLVAALRAGVVNHRAAAEFLDIDGETDAVATALRRFAETLPEYTAVSRDARVRMHSGVGVVDSSEPAQRADAEGGKRDGSTLVVGDTTIVADAGEDTAVVATGEVDPATLSAVLGRLLIEVVDVRAAGVSGGTLVVVVERRHGARALRIVEDTLGSVPVPKDSSVMQE